MEAQGERDDGELESSLSLIRIYTQKGGFCLSWGLYIQKEVGFDPFHFKLATKSPLSTIGMGYVPEMAPFPKWKK